MFTGQISANDIATKAGLPISNVSLDNSSIRSALGKPSGTINYADTYKDPTVDASRAGTNIDPNGAGTSLGPASVKVSDNYILGSYTYNPPKSTATPYTTSGTQRVWQNGQWVTTTFSYTTYSAVSKIDVQFVHIYDKNLNFIRRLDLPTKYYIYQSPDTDGFFSAYYLYHAVVLGDKIMLQNKGGTVYSNTAPRYAILYDITSNTIITDYLIGDSYFLADAVQNCFFKVTANTSTLTLDRYSSQGVYQSTHTITNPGNPRYDSSYFIRNNVLFWRQFAIDISTNTNVIYSLTGFNPSSSVWSYDGFKYNNYGFIMDTLSMPGGPQLRLWSDITKRAIIPGSMDYDEDDSNILFTSEFVVRKQNADGSYPLSGGSRSFRVHKLIFVPDGYYTNGVTTEELETFNLYNSLFDTTSGSNVYLAIGNNDPSTLAFGTGVYRNLIHTGVLSMRKSL